MGQDAQAGVGYGQGKAVFLAGFAAAQQQAVATGALDDDGGDAGVFLVDLAGNRGQRVIGVDLDVDGRPCAGKAALIRAPLPALQGQGA